ncbi:MAG: hypothetical protein IH610_11975 [Deltaproteobacteria bacterium]|nr:hypothetical protein [Deltaproteobacteria bacterium]
MRGSLRKFVLPLLLFLYVACLFGATAWFQGGLFERDGYYHARFAQMMPERGLSRHFPWTQISTWKDSYCDKEFLYHLAMMPFAQVGKEPIFGARLFAGLLSVAVVVTLFFVLRANRTRWPTFFAALPLAMGGLFIARLGMVRSHVLSMLLILPGIHFLLGRKWRALFVLGFVYAWSYTVPFVLLITAAPFVLGRWLGRGGLDWRSVVAAGAGSTLGLALHPYTPITLESILTYVQIFRMGLQGTASSGFELGNEIYPYSPSVFFNIYPLVLITVPLLAALAVGWRRRLAPETVGAVLSSLLWFGMTMASPRFVEYSVLLLAVALALLCRDVCAAESDLPGRFLRNRHARLAILVGALGMLACFHVYSMQFYVYYQGKAAPPRFFQGASVWMARHLAPRETVINLFWDDFPDLFYDAPRQYYLWGLDPTYTIRYDREKAIDMERMRVGRQPLNGHEMKVLFLSRYLILRTSRAGRYPELRFPPFTEVFRDGSAVLFRID